MEGGKMKRNLSLSVKQLKVNNRSDNKKINNRFLITINVLGSAGPLRFVVKEYDVVSSVIDTALKSYAREGRRPLLGSDASSFFLYSATDSEALSPSEAIGSRGGRNFVLCKKQNHEPRMTEAGRSENMIADRKGSGGSSWKVWLSKSFSFKVLSQ